MALASHLEHSGRLWCRNVPSLLNKEHKTETEWYHLLFETDSSIHVSSVWTL